MRTCTWPRTVSRVAETTGGRPPAGGGDTGDSRCPDGPGEASATLGDAPVRRIVVVGRGSRRVELGGPTRIIVPLTGSTPEELRVECRALDGQPVDLVEWRVDHLEELGRGARSDAQLGAVLALLRSACPVPLLATVRTTHEGGHADLDAAGYARVVTELARVGADAVDVEYQREGAQELMETAHAQGAVVIASHHDFAATPPEEEIIARLVAMRDMGADVAKVAYRQRDPWDMFPVLNAQMWARVHLGVPVIAISMGPAGALTRIGGESLGSAATFATVGRGSAPGQFSAREVATALEHMRRP